MVKSTNISTHDAVWQYATDVVAGKIIAGPHVRNSCQRHLDDLVHGHERGLYYDPETAEHVFSFFREQLRLSEGEHEGRDFELEPSQKFMIGCLYGWRQADGRRRFRRAYIEMGKGNGKSPMVGGLGLYGMMADGEPGAQIYAAASKKEQAQILFQDAVKMVRKANNELRSRVTISGGPMKEHNLSIMRTGSFFRPVSREMGKSGSGVRPHYVLADEVHEMRDRSILDILGQGFKGRRQPLEIMITNSGSDRNSLCWHEHENAIKVAAGNQHAKDDDAAYVGDPEAVKGSDAVFSYVCALDPGDDPLTDPSCWMKANPLLGVTIKEDYLQGEVDKARAMPSKLNLILRLHFCVWTDAATAWMTRALLEPALAEFDVAIHKGAKAYGGLDLSQNRDITAKATIVKTGEVKDGEHKGKPLFDAWIEAWTPRDTIDARSLRDKQEYPLWVREGHLQAPKGESISYRHVAQSLAEDAHDFDYQALAYDRYAFKRGLEPEMNALGLSIECVEHPQGGTKKGKPTEGMIRAAKQQRREPEGLWMPASIRQLEELLLERRIRIKINKVLISAMMSAVTDEDRWGNYWLTKDNSANKIDAAIALAMAVGAAIALEDSAHISMSQWLESYKNG